MLLLASKKLSARLSNLWDERKTAQSLSSHFRTKIIPIVVFNLHYADDFCMSAHVKVRITFDSFTEAYVRMGLGLSQPGPLHDAKHKSFHIHWRSSPVVVDTGSTTHQWLQCTNWLTKENYFWWLQQKSHGLPTCNGSFPSLSSEDNLPNIPQSIGGVPPVLLQNKILN